MGMCWPALASNAQASVKADDATDMIASEGPLYGQSRRLNDPVEAQANVRRWPDGAG